MILIFLVIILVLFLFSRNSGNIKNQYAHQGIIASPNYLYVIDNNIIAKLNKSGETIKIFKSSKLTHLNGGTYYGNFLYLTHNPKGSNSVEYFNTELKHINSIEMQYPGSLTWIDYYKKNWWGCLAYYDKEISKTRIMNFTDNKSYKLPDKVLERMKPYSNSGGFWRDDLLYLTGHDKPEIYILELKDELVLKEIRKTKIKGQGISFDSGKIYGIDRSKKEIIIENI